MRENRAVPPSARPAVARWVAALAVAITAVHAVAIALRRMTHAGDFDISREFGRRFLTGEPLYAGGLHYPYLPSAAMAFAPLAALPPWLGFALRYAAALAALWLALRLLASLAGTPAAQRPLGMGLVVLLALHYVLRDLDDAGPHLILLALLVGALWCVRRGADVGAAACVGLAAAVKPPTALLLPFFAWKRQWRLAALAAAALLFWVALPQVWMGPAAWRDAQRQWLTTALASAAGVPDATVADSETRPQNQALRPTVTRVAQRLGADPRTAWWTASAVALLAVAVVAWWSGRCWRGRGDPRWLPEASAVLLLSLLLSPVTWVQHLVLVIPSLALIVDAALAGRLGRAGRAALAVYALLSLGLSRALLGRRVYVELLGLGLHTVCVLILLGLVVAAARTGGAGASPSSGSQDERG